MNWTLTLNLCFKTCSYIYTEEQAQRTVEVEPRVSYNRMFVLRDNGRQSDSRTANTSELPKYYFDITIN